MQSFLGEPKEDLVAMPELLMDVSIVDYPVYCWSQSQTLCEACLHTDPC